MNLTERVNSGAASPADVEAVEVARALAAAPEWRWLRGCSTLGSVPGVVLVAQARPAATPHTGCGVVFGYAGYGDGIGCDGYASCLVCEPEEFAEPDRLPDLQDWATAGALEGLLDTLVDRLMISRCQLDQVELATRWRVVYLAFVQYRGTSGLGWELHNAHTRGAAIGRGLLFEWARRRGATP